MADVSAIALLTSNYALLHLFKKIVGLRKASLRELSEEPDKLDDDKLDDAEAKLTQLRNAKLVAVERAPVREWNTYYVTADGFEVARKIKRFDP